MLSIGFLAHGIREGLGEEIPGGPRLRYVEEPDRRGTAGAIKFAEEYLDDRFLALNGDVLTDLDLSALVRRHEQSGAKATLALYPVEDPTAYGLVRRTEDGEITEFLEKPDPAEIDTDEISAGAYVLERSVLDLIPPDREFSIEREVFPRLVGDGLYSARLEGYWMDIGTPERYLQASWDILERRVETEPGAIVDERGVFVAADAEIDGEASVGESVFAESAVRVDAGATLGPARGSRARLRDRRGRRRQRVRAASRLRDRPGRRGHRLDPRPERSRRRAGGGRARLRDRPGRRDRSRRHRPGGEPDRARRGGRVSAVEKLRAVDPTGQLDAVRSLPEHLRDALWRFDAADLDPVECKGLIVCGMGGSAIGGDLARAAFGDRLTLPMETVRGYALSSATPAERRRLLLELLRGHRGDRRLLRGGRGARGDRGSPRRPAAASPSLRAPKASP